MVPVATRQWREPEALRRPDPSHVRRVGVRRGCGSGSGAGVDRCQPEGATLVRRDHQARRRLSRFTDACLDGLDLTAAGFAPDDRQCERSSWLCTPGSPEALHLRLPEPRPANPPARGRALYLSTFFSDRSGLGLHPGSLGSCLLSPLANSRLARLLSPSTRPGRARMSHFACTVSRKAASPGATSSRISPTGDSMPLPPTCAATARRTVRRRSRRIGTNPSWTIRPRCSTRLACGGGGWSRMIGAR